MPAGPDDGAMDADAGALVPVPDAGADAGAVAVLEAARAQAVATFGKFVGEFGDAAAFKDHQVGLGERGKYVPDDAKAVRMLILNKMLAALNFLRSTNGFPTIASIDDLMYKGGDTATTRLNKKLLVDHLFMATAFRASVQQLSEDTNIHDREDIHDYIVAYGKGKGCPRELIEFTTTLVDAMSCTAPARSLGRSSRGQSGSSSRPATAGSGGAPRCINAAMAMVDKYTWQMYMSFLERNTLDGDLLAIEGVDCDEDGVPIESLKHNAAQDEADLRAPDQPPARGQRDEDFIDDSDLVDGLPLSRQLFILDLIADLQGILSSTSKVVYDQDGLKALYESVIMKADIRAIVAAACRAYVTDEVEQFLEKFRATHGGGSGRDPAWWFNHLFDPHEHPSIPVDGGRPEDAGPLRTSTVYEAVAHALRHHHARRRAREGFAPGAARASQTHATPCSAPVPAA